MNIELNEKELRLFGLLRQIPPDFEGAKKWLSAEQFSQTALTKVALAYVEECEWEVEDEVVYRGCDRTTDVVPNLHSSYICDVVGLLLQHGLNPNDIYNIENIMQNVTYVDNGFLAADTMMLLLENGGDPDLEVEIEPLFSEVDNYVFFDAVEQEDRIRYEQYVRCWMVMLGYRGHYEHNCQLFREYDSSEMFDLRKLKNYRDYYVGLLRIDGRTCICIFDKATMWEVARFW